MGSDESFYMFSDSQGTILTLENSKCRNQQSPRKREGILPSKTLSPTPWLPKKLP